MSNFVVGKGSSKGDSAERVDYLKKYGPYDNNVGFPCLGQSGCGWRLLGAKISHRGLETH